MNKLHEEHVIIYNAIVEQNATNAVKAMESHLLEVKETILANFKEQ
ncbi:transcriptional regulator [Staphylococcus sp. OJ82]|nr:transcriptional regulator [Staphylococcus sp. OJ82]